MAPCKVRPRAIWRLLIRQPWGVAGDPSVELSHVMRQAVVASGMRIKSLAVRGSSKEFPTASTLPESPSEVPAEPSPAGTRTSDAVTPSTDDWYHTALAELQELHQNTGDPGTIRRLAAIEANLQALRDQHSATYGLALLADGQETAAYERLQAVPKRGDYFGDRDHDAMHFLARQELKLQEYERALGYLETLGTRGTAETEGLRGLAHHGLRSRRRARRSLQRALQMGYLDREVVLAFADVCDVDGGAAEAGRHLRQWHEQEPADLTVVTRLTTLYADNPELIAELTDRCVQALEHEDQIKAAADIFRDRAEALVRLGAPGQGEALADAVEALLLSGREAEALKLAQSYGSDQQALNAEHYIDLLSLLEAARSPDIRDGVVQAYSALAQHEILQMPQHDAARLRDLTQRLFILDRRRFAEIKQLYEFQLAELTAEPEELLGSFVAQLP